MPEVKFKIISNKKIKGKCYRLIINAPAIAKTAQPGQFLQVKVNDGCEPLLRRPFSIYNLDKSRVEILYEVLGQGTEILSKRKPKERLDVIGPLGNGFNYREPRAGNREPILVAGGMGVAPLLFLAKKLNKLYAKRYTLNAIIGARTKSQILCEKEFKKAGYSVKIATDDGSRGFKGRVTELLEHELRTTNDERRTIYACGPRPMLKEIARLSQVYNIPAELSLEEHMSCGIGACFGCVVDTKDGFQRVCKEGPVFKAGEIVF